MVEHLRRRDDVDGCACLRCRGVDAAVLRRSIAGDLLWATTLLWRYPSLVALTVLLTLVSGLLWPILEAGPQTWPVGTALAFYIALHGTVLRTYAVAVTTDALLGADRSASQRFLGSLRRLPAVVATLASTLAAGAIALALTSLAVYGIVTTVEWLGGVTGIAVAADTVFDGRSATVVFGSTTALGVVKFWLAPEICVAGGCGPLAALRTSWAITRVHRLRVLIVVVGFVLTAFGPEVGRRAVATLGGQWLLWEPVTGLAQGLFYGFTYAVWFAVGAQIYVRYALRPRQDGQTRF